MEFQIKQKTKGAVVTCYLAPYTPGPEAVGNILLERVIFISPFQEARTRHGAYGRRHLCFCSSNPPERSSEPISSSESIVTQRYDLDIRRKTNYDHILEAASRSHSILHPELLCSLDMLEYSGECKKTSILLIMLYQMSI